MQDLPAQLQKVARRCSGVCGHPWTTLPIRRNVSYSPGLPFSLKPLPVKCSGPWVRRPRLCPRGRWLRDRLRSACKTESAAMPVYRQYFLLFEFPQNTLPVLKMQSLGISHRCQDHAGWFRVVPSRSSSAIRSCDKERFAFQNMAFGCSPEHPAHFAQGAANPSLDRRRSARRDGSYEACEASWPPATPALPRDQRQQSVIASSASAQIVQRPLHRSDASSPSS